VDPSTCASRYADLASACEISSTSANVLGGASSQQLLGPVGADAVFLQYSTLFDASIAQNPQDWYNVSKAAGEMNTIANQPYGFYFEPMPQYSDGYPIFFSTQLTNARVNDMLLYLRDGNYLNANNTDSMTAEVGLALARLLVGCRPPS
jgi:hypothetical protein